MCLDRVHYNDYIQVLYLYDWCFNDLVITSTDICSLIFQNECHESSQQQQQKKKQKQNNNNNNNAGSKLTCTPHQPVSAPLTFFGARPSRISRIADLGSS